MKRTIRWPPNGGRVELTADPDDGAADVEARGEALRQVVRLSVLDGRSGNPWNAADRLGVGDATFAQVSSRRNAGLQARIREQFARLERTRRAKLQGVSARRDPDDRAAVIVAVEYADLETGGREKMEVTRGAAR